MNPGLSRHDERLLDRFLDDVLQGDDLAVCRRRLEQEPALRAALQERQRLRAGFLAGRGAAFTPPVNFAAGVVAAARRLPASGPSSSSSDGPGSRGSDPARLCRRILWFAAAVFAA